MTRRITGKKMDDKKMKNRSLFFYQPSFCHILYLLFLCSLAVLQATEPFLEKSVLFTEHTDGFTPYRNHG